MASISIGQACSVQSTATVFRIIEGTCDIDGATALNGQPIIISGAHIRVRIFATASQ